MLNLISMIFLRDNSTIEKLYALVVERYSEKGGNLNPFYTSNTFLCAPSDYRSPKEQEYRYSPDHQANILSEYNALNSPQEYHPNTTNRDPIK